MAKRLLFECDGELDEQDRHPPTCETHATVAPGEFPEGWTPITILVGLGKGEGLDGAPRASLALCPACRYPDPDAVARAVDQARAMAEKKGRKVAAGAKR